MINSAKPWVYYASMLGVLLASFASRFLSELAQEKTPSLIENIGIYTVVQYSLMAVFMMLAWLTSPKSTRLKSYKTLFIVAALTRVLLLDTTPYTSNDVSRYLFDGRLAYEGIDPYRVSHDAPELAPLRALWQPPQEHAAYVTLYPPLALALFSFSSSFGLEWALLVWKALLLVAALLTVWLTAVVLKAAGKLENLPLVALSPMLILETGLGLHLDALSTLAVVSALYLWQQKRMLACGVAIGVGVAVKILPIMLLLPLLFIQRSFKSSAALLVACILTVLVSYTLAFVFGYHPIGSIGVFFEKWRFASPLFSVLDHLLPPYPLKAVLLSIAMVSVGAIAILSFRIREKTAAAADRVFNYMQWSLALPLVLSPVLFPWYLLPLVPLLALRPNAFLLAWLLLMPLTYEVLGEFLCCQHWEPALWPTVLLGGLYAMVFVSLLHSMSKYKRRSEFGWKREHVS